MENKEMKPRLKKGLWKPDEDLLLKKYVETHGEGNWATVSQKSGVTRGGKSCRLRWKNYLRPNIKRGSMSDQEKDLIIRLHKLLGNRWSLIAGRLPGRTDNEVKNYWNTHLKKRSSPVTKATNIDPNTRDIKLNESPANSSQPSTRRTKKSSCEEEGLAGRQGGRNKNDSELFNHEVSTSSLSAPYNNAPFWFDDDNDHIIPILESFLLL